MSGEIEGVTLEVQEKEKIQWMCIALRYSNEDASRYICFLIGTQRYRRT